MYRIQSALCVFLTSVLLLAGCQILENKPTQQAFSTPPTPLISWKDKSAVSVPTSYCWTYENTGTCVDTAAPPEVIAEKKPAAMQVKPGAVITISYDLPPVEKSLSIYRWVGSSQIEQAVENGNQWKAPDQPGWYLYDVRAQWDQGDAGHAFVIEVKSNASSQLL